MFVQYPFDDTLDARMNPSTRQHYRPKTDALPRWLHRVWAWF